MATFLGNNLGPVEYLFENIDLGQKKEFKEKDKASGQAHGGIRAYDITNQNCVVKVLAWMFNHTVNVDGKMYLVGDKSCKNFFDRNVGFARGNERLQSALNRIEKTHAFSKALIEVKVSENDLKEVLRSIGVQNKDELIKNKFNQFKQSDGNYVFDKKKFFDQLEIKDIKVTNTLGKVVIECKAGKNFESIEKIFNYTTAEGSDKLKTSPPRGEPAAVPTPTHVPQPTEHKPETQPAPKPTGHKPEPQPAPKPAEHKKPEPQPAPQPAVDLPKEPGKTIDLGIIDQGIDARWDQLHPMADKINDWDDAKKNYKPEPELLKELRGIQTAISKDIEIIGKQPKTELSETLHSDLIQQQEWTQEAIEILEDREKIAGKQAEVPSKSVQGGQATNRLEVGMVLPEGVIHMNKEKFTNLQKAFTFPEGSFDFILGDLQRSFRGEEGNIDTSRLFELFHHNSVHVNDKLPGDLDITSKHLAEEYKQFSFMRVDQEAGNVEMNKNAFMSFATSVGLKEPAAKDVWKNLAGKGPSFESSIKDMWKQFELKGADEERFNHGLLGPQVVTDKKEFPSGAQEVKEQQLIQWFNKPESIPEGTMVVAKQMLQPLLDQSQFSQRPSFQDMRDAFAEAPDAYMVFHKSDLQSFMVDLKDTHAQSRVGNTLLAIADKAYVEEPQITEVEEEPIQKEASSAKLVAPSWHGKDPLDGKDPTAPEAQDSAMYGKTFKELSSMQSFASINAEDGKKLHALAYGLNLKHVGREASLQDKDVSIQMWKKFKTLPLFQQFLVYEIAKVGGVDSNSKTQTELRKELIANFKNKSTDNKSECVALRNFLGERKDLAKNEENASETIRFFNGMLRSLPLKE